LETPWYKELFPGTSIAKDKKAINAVEFSQALESATKCAYEAILTPTEGTILTVISDSAKGSKEIVNTEMSIPNFIDELVKISKVSLDNTPNLLPVLKEVGVVDSGGMGLYMIFQGMDKFFKNEKLTVTEPQKINLTSNKTIMNSFNTADIDKGYCTEFMIKTKKPINKNEFKEYLASIGDSLVLVEDEDVVKVHVHTETPNEAMTQALKFGQLFNIKIENMRFQHDELIDSHEMPN
jgi:dihydroxyacetone kinase-like predicted kinase